MIKLSKNLPFYVANEKRDTLMVVMYPECNLQFGFFIILPRVSFTDSANLN
jgi:hypothetical protein